MDEDSGPILSIFELDCGFFNTTFSHVHQCNAVRAQFEMAVVPEIKPETIIKSRQTDDGTTAAAP